MKKLLFWVAVASGATAAYLMYKRGVPVGDIASSAFQHPFGALKNELRTTL